MPDSAGHSRNLSLAPHSPDRFTLPLAVSSIHFPEFFMILATSSHFQKSLIQRTARGLSILAGIGLGLLAVGQRARHRASSARSGAG